jgi:hypothetical protein
MTKKKNDKIIQIYKNLSMSNILKLVNYCKVCFDGMEQKHLT